MELTQNRNLRARLRNFLGLPLDRPLIMGIVNVTPDSFSDGGRYFNTREAISHGLKQLEDGADIIDVGGESTRPGALPVDLEEELRRVIPVIKELVKSGARISIDTRNSEVMKRALESGVSILNDVSALEGEGSLEIARQSDAAIILMHMNGTPETMMNNTEYHDVVEYVDEYLGRRITSCVTAGINRERIAIDPGFGFGKTRDQNLEIVNNLHVLIKHGCPILVGLSRKFGYHKPVDCRLPESLAIAVKAVINGADIVRVHDVAETYAALQAIRYGGS